MKKIKISVTPFLKFLRELSVIVTGIIITVGLGLLVNKRNNEKDLKLFLTAVAMELEENADKCDLYATWMQKSVRYANYLKSNDFKSLDADSLAFYAYTTKPRAYTEEEIKDGAGCGFANTSSGVDWFTTFSFDMLQMSGILRQVKDKALLSSIWRAYTQIISQKNGIERAFRLKEEEYIKEQQLILEGKPFGAPMRTFYSYDLPESIVDHCQATSIVLRETVSKLEEAKMVNR